MTVLATTPLTTELGGFVIRPATDGDVPSLIALHERCSADTLRYRYLSSRAPSHDLIARLLRNTRTYVVDSDDGIVAMGNLHLAGATAELALLVEDRWQAHGLGPLLGSELTAAAVAAGADELVAVTAGSNHRVHDLMTRLGLRRKVEYLDGVAYVNCPLPPDLVR